MLQTPPAWKRKKLPEIKTCSFDEVIGNSDKSFRYSQDAARLRSAAARMDVDEKFNLLLGKNPLPELHSPRINQIPRDRQKKKITRKISLPHRVPVEESMYSIYETKIDMSPVVEPLGFKNQMPLMIPKSLDIISEPVTMNNTVTGVETQTSPRLIPVSPTAGPVGVLAIVGQFKRLDSEKVRNCIPRCRKPLLPPQQQMNNIHLTQSMSPMSKSHTNHTKRPKTLVRSVVNLVEFEDILDNMSDDFNGMLNASNGVSIANIVYGPVYKFYLGKGNNKQIIKRALGIRGRWAPTKDIDSANFVWTQWKLKSYFHQLFPAGEKPNKTAKYTPAYEMIRQKGRRHQAKEEYATAGILLVCDSKQYTSYRPACEDLNPNNIRLVNKLEKNTKISNKKNLFYHMKTFYTAKGINYTDNLPFTFHITNQADFTHFVGCYNKVKLKENCKNVWIVKPGENSNRGQAISIYDNLQEMQSHMSKLLWSERAKNRRSFIVQKYIENPLLIHGRKFDIRAYALISSINGKIQGYYYHEGYLRTSSKLYSLENFGTSIHLTNDAIQKNQADFGKHESCNKLSYGEFQKYLEITYDGKVNFSRDIHKKLRQIIIDTIEALAPKLDPNRRKHSFELFGYDFMIDDEFNVYLIEVNTNPCLETESTLLSRIIPALIDNTLKIVLDPLFPNRQKKNKFGENKFELVYSN